ncbi:DUF2252 domain-containing protein [Paenibacillus sp. HJL G12]|uniref:DUF2252 domain-containing protein n=1 Tax=Paenibacillus dendrobii TaxID=2691084 RepID=A0A7X3IHA3_9BACL|nr:DUF2252 family protein [Paenibacillus dendrobii]MWV43923.1 DUF2252 domain-containing protein [Paenibacillus dendrobii]
MPHFNRKDLWVKKITIAIMAALLLDPAASSLGWGGHTAHAEESDTASDDVNANPPSAEEQPNDSNDATENEENEVSSEIPENPGDAQSAEDPDVPFASLESYAVPESDKPVVISKVFGGGSQNEDALYKYDFVELYNPADTEVSLSGWSVQYAVSTAKTDSTSWQVTPLHGTIPAKGYYLIQEAASKSTLNGPDLPTPDDTGSIDMDNKDGKVALVAGTVALTTANPAKPAASSLVDFVGYGAAPSYDGSGAAPTPSAQKTLVRKAEDPVLGTGVPSIIGSDAELYGNGWNTHDNKADFDIATLGTFAPHNAMSLTPLSAKADANLHTVKMANLREISASDAQFVVTMTTGSLKQGELNPQDYEVGGLPAGLSVTRAEADPQLHQVTFTIGGTTTADVTSSVELGIVIRKSAVSSGAYDDSRTVRGITLENNTPKISGELVSNTLAMRGPTTASGSFAIRVKTGTVKEGELTDGEFTVTGLPEGLKVQAIGDAVSNQVIFTVSGTAVTPIIEAVPLTVVLKASAVVTEGSLDSEPMTGIMLDRYKTPVQADEKRRAELTQRIREGNAYYNDPDAKSYKYGTSGMAATAAAFYRGAPYLMYQDLGAAIPIPDSWKKLVNVKTWIEGDAHIANVGFYDDKPGQIIFDLNDFDGSYIAPFYLDLLRMTSSLYLTRDSEKLGLSDAEIRDMATDMLNEYMLTLQTLIGNDNKNTAATKLDMNHVNDGFTKTIMTKLAKKTQLDHLIKWTVPTADGKHSTGVFNVAGKTDKYRQPSSAERAEVELNWQKYVDTLAPDFVQAKLAENPDYFKIKDVAVRIYQGLGSIGSQRYNVLIEGPTASHDDDIILDVKQAFKPDMFENADGAETTPYDSFPGGDGARVKTAYEKLSLDAEPFLGYFNSSTRSFFVHKISLYKGDYEDASGGTFKTKENLADYVGYIAKAYAYGHARSSGPDDAFEKSVISQVYDSGEQWKSFETTLLNLGEDYYRQVASDYELMKADLIGGKLIDVAGLSALGLNGASLSPAFATDKLNYTASVGSDVSSIEMTVSSLDGKASMTVNGAAYTTGTPKVIELRPGANRIDVIVTAQDGGTTQTYTVEIQRQGSTGGGNDGNGGNTGGNTGGNGGDGGNAGGNTGSNNGNTGNGSGSGTTTSPGQGNTGGLAPEPIVIDADKFGKALSDAQSGPSKDHQLIFNVTEHATNGLVIQLPLEKLQEASKLLPDLKLTVNTEAGSYSLLVQTIDFESLVKGLGVQGGAGTFNIRIAPIAGPNLADAQAKLKAANLEPVSATVEFALFAELNGKQSDISHLGKHYSSMVIPYTTKNPANELVVVRINADGTTTVVPAVFADGKAAFYSPDTGIYAVAHAMPRTFADITKHWAKSEIELLAGKRIVQGTSAEAFSPDKVMSRAELTSLFTKAFALQEDQASAGFSDVAAAAWYAGAIGAASKAGIVTGFPGGEFKPSEALTREQMAVMMVKAAELAGKPLQRLSGAGAAVPFKDADRISGYAQTAVNLCREAGIIRGNPDGSFSPAAPVTRAEAAVMIKQLLQQIGFMN